MTRTMGSLAAFLDRLRASGPQWRYGLRVTVAGLAAFAATQFLDFPLHGLWAVLTAIVVSQVSVGGSLRATIEYNIGTLGGALYAVVVGLAVPHATPVWQALALALSVGPLALAATVHPSMRVAPFSAVLVLLIGSELGESPLASAGARVLEVAIGGAVALLVSLVVFPERAHGLGRDAAGRILSEMAALLPKLLDRASRDADSAEVGLAQGRLDDAVRAFEGLAEDTRRERIVSLGPNPDPAPLARSLRRIRHDLVMIGRTTAERFTEPIADRLASPLTLFGEAAAAFLRGSAAALASGASAPSISPAEAARGAYEAEVAAIRAEGLSRALQTADLERFFTLGFALEQLCDNLADLAPRVREPGGGLPTSPI